MTERINIHLIAKAFCLATVMLCANVASATILTLHVGPPSLGNGGNNPLSIPPVNPIEYEFTWVTDNDWETTVGITPGIFFGRRATTSDGLYVSMGGGLALNANGGGPGVYSAIGMNVGNPNSIQFNTEFKQAMGGTSTGMVFPNALRMGLALGF